MSDPASSVHRSLQAVIDESSLWLLFALIGGTGASVMALGMLLRSNQQITQRAVIGTLLHSIAWGIAVFLLVYGQYSLTLSFTVGLSMLSGMGAASFIDMVLLIVKQRMGINVVIQRSADSQAGELK